jgi:hypothetical protein
MEVVDVSVFFTGGDMLARAVEVTEHMEFN